MDRNAFPVDPFAAPAQDRPRPPNRTRSANTASDDQFPVATKALEDIPRNMPGIPQWLRDSISKVINAPAKATNAPVKTTNASAKATNAPTRPPSNEASRRVEPAMKPSRDTSQDHTALPRASSSSSQNPPGGTISPVGVPTARRPSTDNSVSPNGARNGNGVPPVVLNRQTTPPTNPPTPQFGQRPGIPSASMATPRAPAVVAPRAPAAATPISSSIPSPSVLPTTAIVTATATATAVPSSASQSLAASLTPKIIGDSEQTESNSLIVLPTSSLTGGGSSSAFASAGQANSDSACSGVDCPMFGIIIGSLVGAFILATLIVVFVIRRKRQRAAIGPYTSRSGSNPSAGSSGPGSRGYSTAGTSLGAPPSGMHESIPQTFTSDMNMAYAPKGPNAAMTNHEIITGYRNESANLSPIPSPPDQGHVHGNGAMYGAAAGAAVGVGAGTYMAHALAGPSSPNSLDSRRASEWDALQHQGNGGLVGYDSPTAPPGDTRPIDAPAMTFTAPVSPGAIPSYMPGEVGTDPTCFIRGSALPSPTEHDSHFSMDVPWEGAGNAQWASAHATPQSGRSPRDSAISAGDPHDGGLPGHHGGYPLQTTHDMLNIPVEYDSDDDGDAGDWSVANREGGYGAGYGEPLSPPTVQHHGHQPAW